MKTDNELIAEFMGLDIDGNNVTDGVAETTLDKLHYHTSWDWLMPVVEKISKMPTVDNEDSYYPRTFGMRDADGHPMVRINRCPLYTANTLIEATHAAVVEFIKMHNEPKTES